MCAWSINDETRAGLNVTYVQATRSGNTNASSTTISVECPSNAPYVLWGYAT